MNDNDECYEHLGTCISSCPIHMEPEYYDEFSSSKQTGKCVETECSKRDALSSNGCGDDCFRYYY
jgi:hypothetical protein